MAAGFIPSALIHAPVPSTDCKLIIFRLCMLTITEKYTLVIIIINVYFNYQGHFLKYNWAQYNSSCTSGCVFFIYTVRMHLSGSIFEYLCISSSSVMLVNDLFVPLLWYLFTVYSTM